MTVPMTPGLTIALSADRSSVLRLMVISPYVHMKMLNIATYAAP